MCNDYEQHVIWAEYRELMRRLELTVPAQQSELDLPTADDVKIGDTSPVMRSAGDMVELAPMRFGLPPQIQGAVLYLTSARMVEASRRANAVSSPPAPSSNSRERGTRRLSIGAPQNASFMAIAGLWRDGQGNQPPSFTMLTTEPGPDVEPYHNRRVVVLRPEDWGSWIDLTKPEGELLRPLPAGSFDVQTVRPGSD